MPIGKALIVRANKDITQASRVILTMMLRSVLKCVYEEECLK